MYFTASGGTISTTTSSGNVLFILKTIYQLNAIVFFHFNMLKTIYQLNVIVFFHYNILKNSLQTAGVLFEHNLVDILKEIDEDFIE